MKLQNKNCLITGGTRGIGRAIALSFAREGANIFFTYQSRSDCANSLIEELELLNVNCSAYEADLANSNNLNSIVTSAISALGQIDILVNNAGIVSRSAFIDIFEEEFDAIMAINTKAPFILMQQTARHMIENDVQGGIINISSISGIMPARHLAHYECSKASLRMLTKSAALELSPHKIRVNSILPGLTRTDMTEGVPENRADNILLGRKGEPDDIANAAIYLASNDSSWVTGTELVVDGGETLSSLWQII